VVYAEPLFEIQSEEQQPVGRPRSRGLSGGDNDPGTDRNFEWSLDALRVKEAWALFGSDDPGTGIVVGHPDTGYTDHPEILSARLLSTSGFDFQDDDDDAHDPLVGGLLRNPGHGTGTSSVIFSGRGGPAVSATDPFVSGTAPGASLIPIRTTKSVVLWSMSRLVRAIRYAIAKKVHVISISLGGPVGGSALHNAVIDAERSGVIVLCAAGNQVHFVVFPAAFDEVLAVAASRIDDSQWPGSCRGPAVDITAPGSSVWRARTAKKGSAATYDVARGSGTSFAVAAAAGVAALWLAYHDRQSLIAKYGADRLSSVFKSQLQASCRTPPGWDTQNFGPGIANAEALLGEALPDARRVRAARSRSVRAPLRPEPLEVLAHLLAPAPLSGVARALAELLQTDEARLPAVLRDVGAELAMQIGTDSLLRARLRAAATAWNQGRRGPRGRPQAHQARRRVLQHRTSKRLREELLHKAI
jgi:serine protease